MKFKKEFSALLISSIILSSSFITFGKEVSSQNFQMGTIKEIADIVNLPTIKEQFNLNMHRLTKSAESINAIQGELIDPTVVDELKFENNTNVTDNVYPEDIGESIAITPRSSNYYYWNSQTAYFEPSKMNATKDIDIIWNRYQPGNEKGLNANYQPMGYPSLSTSTYTSGSTQASFDSTVNQGHVNDYLASAVYGSHSYYTVMTHNFDTITAFASNKVRVRIADMTTKSWVFDSGYGSNGQSMSPAAGGDVSYYSTSNTTSFGASKTVYHIKFDTSVGAKSYCVVLSPYEPYYPTSFDQVDNLDPTYHYAFYAGEALPGKLSTSNIAAHSSTVKYIDSLKYVSSFDSATTATTISAGTPVSQNNLYALRSITVNEYVPSRSNLYITNLNYKFKWPGSSSFYNLYGSSDTYTYTFSASTCPIGTWQFMFSGMWKSPTNTNNYFSGRTYMSMEYLAPYGYVAKY